METKGSTLGAAFFAYKNKKATLYLSGLSGLARGEKTDSNDHAQEFCRWRNQFNPSGQTWFLSKEDLAFSSDGTHFPEV